MSETPQENPNPEQRRYLHLKEINVVFNNRRPNSKMSVKIEVAGEKTYQSPVFGRKKDIEWKCDRFVVSSASVNVTIRKSCLPTMKITKKYSSFDVQFGADNIGENKTVALLEDPRFTVDLVFGASRAFLIRTKLQDVARLLSKEATTALASKVVLLDNIDKILNFSEQIMRFAEAVAELHPIAGLVVGALQVALENCQKISKCHDEVVTLMKEMVSLVCLPELVRDRIKEPATKEAMDNFLVLVKDTADALTEYASLSGTSFYARNWFKPKQATFTDLRQRFTAVKQNMDLYLGASTYLVVHETQGTVHATHEVVLSTQGAVQDIHQTTDNTYTSDMTCR
ncbi:hypothetical protein DFH11DRAFT_1747901 [Phellopilus nigrolimitatus]|nr:hypothetical protein DFH11DRAFT_1747901 [Phellopilus nigrolimitatus]